MLFVSHRLANTVDADQIYVLQDGRVAEHGTHGELLEHEGAYARLWHAQRELEEFGMECVVPNAPAAHVDVSRGGMPSSVAVEGVLA